MTIPVMAIQLPGESEFATRFNYVGQLFQKANDSSLPEEERKEWEKKYESQKLNLEQGWPINYSLLDA